MHKRECPVLVVEDDRAIREFVVEALRLEGYFVAAAANGADAVAAIEAFHSAESEYPLVVLLDMRMPVLDGWGVAAALKERGIRVPIIVMTAAQDAHAWAAEVEANETLPKPFSLADLYDTVERVRQSAARGEPAEGTAGTGGAANPATPDQAPT